LWKNQVFIKRISYALLTLITTIVFSFNAEYDLSSAYKMRPGKLSEYASLRISIQETFYFNVSSV
ncbi:hypothetical protein, partial [Leptospira kirschneri]